MIIEISDLTPIKILLGFFFGFMLAVLLCTPGTINDTCIKYDGITYCEVSK